MRTARFLSALGFASLSLTLLPFDPEGAVRTTPSRAALSATFEALAAATAGDSSARVFGTWAGTMEHDGEKEPIVLTFEPGEENRVLVRVSIPAIHWDHLPLGQAVIHVRADSVTFGPFAFAWTDGGRALRGLMPAAFVPVYRIPMTLRRVDGYTAPPRPEATAPVREARWTYVAGSALWAGPTFADGSVYAGAADGTLHALSARNGNRRWTFQAGGAIRSRPLVERGVLYVHADDGMLYAIDQANGRLRWKVAITGGPIERSESRYERFGSDVVISNNRLFVGTHDGRLLALDPADGETFWSFQTGDAVLAAPAVAVGRVLFGSHDEHVYALDAANGSLIWKTDTQGAVVSTPAMSGNLAIVGNRSYDLLGLEVETGRVAWKRYIWMSWVESSPRLFDGVAYVGSSDAAAVYAVAPERGEILWKADVFGWAWGQPAVTPSRVYAGASSQVGYAAGHRGGFFALDRQSGAMAWRYVVAVPDSGAYGFPGSPALGAGLVFATTIDGRVLAFDP